jgi:LuxR family maltose regulon positive regulatory protein
LASTYQAQNQPDKAREVVDSVVVQLQETNNTLLLPVAYAYQAELAAQQGRMPEANQYVTRASSTPPTMALPAFYSPQLALPKILLVQNTTTSLQQASDYLSKLHSFLKSIHNKRFLIDVLILQALVYNAQGSPSSSMDVLEQAVTMAQPNGYIRPFIDQGSKLEHLLAQLPKNNVSPAYIEQIITAYQSSEKPDSSASLPATKGVSQHRLHSELPELLTNREMDVLLLLAERKTNKEIAQELGISPETAKKHSISLYRKFDVHNRREAVVRARNLGILP